MTSGLGAEEQQAIGLALEAGGLLLIDDRAGKAAGQLGIAITGAVGILLKAEQDGHQGDTEAELHGTGPL